jgi:2-dehydro-3-deoxyphosphogluconate aldolase/(4S)-4-hydroxy-2-oxoglutarate aldolase
MTARDAVQWLTAEGLIPVIRVDRPEAALKAAQALRGGGASVLEVTMSVPGALEVIGELARGLGQDVLLGAGSIVDPQTAGAALSAGARFIVSPILNRNVIRLCVQRSVAVIPGAMTPTEIVTAWRWGASLVKVFPAAQLGGAAYIRALRGPLPQIPLVPTGGVTLESVPAYIQAGAAALGVGGELVDKAALARGALAVVSEKTAAYLQAIRAARGG